VGVHHIKTQQEESPAMTSPTAVSPRTIDAWRTAPTEHANLEFKEAKSTFDFDRLCQYCVALANEGGGHLLLGDRLSGHRGNGGGWSRQGG